MSATAIDWHEINGLGSKFSHLTTSIKYERNFEVQERLGANQVPKGVSVSGVRFAFGSKSNSFLAGTEISSYRLNQEKLSEESMMLAVKWKTSVLDRSAGRKSKDLTKTTEPVFEALLKLGPSAIDLRDLPENLINGAHLAVVLRATFTRRTQVPGWSRALQIAKRNLESSGANVKSVLAGLI